MDLAQTTTVVRSDPRELTMSASSVWLELLWLRPKREPRETLLLKPCSRSFLLILSRSPRCLLTRSMKLLSETYLPLDAMPLESEWPCTWLESLMPLHAKELTECAHLVCKLLLLSLTLSRLEISLVVLVVVWSPCLTTTWWEVLTLTS